MSTPRPAECLVGRKLKGQWEVTSRTERSSDATGARNSIGYIAKDSDGKAVFVKAIDLARSKRYADPLDVLTEKLNAYKHERDICLACREQGMKRVVHAIGEGEEQVGDGLDGMVPYIVFEMADGDIRHAIERAAYFDAAWALRTLHNISVGYGQLHAQDIAHLDMKPSNALVCNGNVIKVGDLGQAVRRGRSSPHEEYIIPGDESYAPPELRYSHRDPEWNVHRLGSDLWLLGNLAVYLFARVNMLALLSNEMDGTYHWRQWKGTYADVLPYLREGFDRAMAHFEQSVRNVTPENVCSETISIVRQLCDPDPRRRGNPSEVSRSGRGRYSVERYISRFDFLAKRCQLAM